MEQCGVDRKHCTSQHVSICTFVLRCQYLHFSTSKASKLGTVGVVEAVGREEVRHAVTYERNAVPYERHAVTYAPSVLWKQ